MFHNLSVAGFYYNHHLCFLKKKKPNQISKDAQEICVQLKNHIEREL